jgi:hypothetical protein
MKKLLTICICTRDRVELLKSLFIKIKNLKTFNAMNWVICDNSTLIDNRLANLQNVLKILGLDPIYVLAPSLFEARNRCMDLVDTSYFTWLDDDDWITDDLLIDTIQILNNYPEVEFISFNNNNPNKYEDISNKVITPLQTLDEKFNYLSRFDNYSEDKFSKVYLGNPSNIYSTDLFRREKIQYFSNTCDDVYPITKAYIKSKLAVKTNKTNYYYYHNNTIQKEKTSLELSKFENDEIKSYEKLIHELTPSSYKILSRCIENSYMQLLSFDGLNSIKLKQLGVYCNDNYIPKD